MPIECVLGRARRRRPDGSSRSASKRLQTRSSSGRSTWHETTAYRFSPAMRAVSTLRRRLRRRHQDVRASPVRPSEMTGRTAWRAGTAPRRLPYALVAAAAILPRLGVLLHERGTITAAYVD